MFLALLYLQYQSLKNRAWLRFRRLKQPKYLVGGIVGALYFYFYFFRYVFAVVGPRPSLSLGSSPETSRLYESLGAAMLLVVVLMAWLVPHGRAALAFSEAEVAFLFPAPISRRGLIHFKLLRSQAAILFTTLILMLLTKRFGGRLWIHAVGWWLILSTLNLHLLGSSFARTMLLDRGISNWSRRLVILGCVIAIVLGVLIWARESLPSFDLSQMTDPNSMQEYFEKFLTSGPVPWLLYPFELVVRPFLATNGQAFLRALFPALALVALHYWWVARADVAFEEASVEASKKIAQKIAAVRSGNLHLANTKVRGKRPPFALGSTGSPAIALLWKNLISAGRAFTLRLWIIVAGSAVLACTFLARSWEDSNLVLALGMGAGLLLIWSLFIGPQVLRQDLRQDLALADVLKMYPVRGWEVALGELLAPGAILTAIQWVLLLVAVVLLWSVPSAHLTRATILSLGAGAALVLPLLNLLILQIPNASVLLFPAWSQLGKERTHGLEVTGQRIIALSAQLLVFIVTLIPATVAFGLVWFLAGRLLDRAVAVLLASLGAAIILAAETALGVVLLGLLFERFDVSSELPT